MTIIDNLLPHVLYAIGGYLAGVVTAFSALYWAGRRAVIEMTDDEWRLVAEERLRELKPWPERPALSDEIIAYMNPSTEVTFRDLAASDRARRGR